jgi:uncharacterized repeat protein (TIGR03803 family)
MMDVQGNRRCAAMIVIAVSMALAAAIAASAQSFFTLHDFDFTDGETPLQPVVQGADGALYGTTSGGGIYARGTVFKIAHDGTLTTLHSFCAEPACADGESPTALIYATDGNFYGTTQSGGLGAYCPQPNSCGTLFRITSAGELTTLYNFCSQVNCSDGAVPNSVIQGADGSLFGVTGAGGAGFGGTAFKATLAGGTLTTLHSFCSQENCFDGRDPIGQLVQATDGNLYGTTYLSGVNGSGTAFRLTPGGALTILYAFCSESSCADGSNPVAGFVQANDGNLYGATLNGGANNDGTVFKITLEGGLTTLHSFDGTDGSSPQGPLIQATDGNLYGASAGGGTNNTCYPGCGTIFKMTLAGGLTTLHDFDSTRGANPSGVVQATNGAFYGTTAAGGTSRDCGSFGCGVVYGLSVGLEPFVETVPSAGRSGRSVNILGNDVTGATSVTFDGAAAVFTVESATAIKTTVPAGATTGPVQVVTPNGTLTSNVNFQVLP